MIYQNMDGYFSPYGFPYISEILTQAIGFDNHCHRELEIAYVLRGALQIFCGQDVYQLKEGEILIIPPFVSHAFLAPAPGTDRLVIEVDMDILGTASMLQTDILQYREQLVRQKTCSIFWNPQTTSRVKALILEMHEEYTHQKEGWKFALSTLLARVLLTAVREFPSRAQEPAALNLEKLQTSIEFIGTHFDKNISLQECAEATGYSPAYFSRFFKAHMGTTFQEYVKNVRLEKAKWLLLSTSLPITEICYQAGFTDVKTFNKIFKQALNESPSSFRSAHFTQLG